ncbi:hypothetical protein DFH29DRAFT_897369 [Suillus ampliporus]|nr:hypothetical protein DFH29DRAFT_897369 [Suillus ampliporus]
MAPVAFSGTIPSKRKADLQTIALALHISDSGTRDELQARIKRHLEQHQSKYEDDPTFSGLYGKKKKSVQPALGRFVPGSPEDSEERSPQVTRSARRVVPVGSRETIPVGPREITPVDDMRNVSMMLKHLPISPESLARLQISVQKAYSIHLVTTRAVLSDSTNIWFLTALLELLYVLYMVIPWQIAELASGSRSQFYLAIPYPPAQTFLQLSFWTVLFHWSVPTILIPLVFGLLVSFHPANSTSVRIPRVLALDPLSASIARLAAHVVYPFQTLDASLQGVDVIGQRWRLLTASVVVAFAFAEAIFSAPSAFAESRTRLRAGTPRRTIAPEDTLVSVTAES